jgi:hypothetical protein
MKTLRSYESVIACLALLVGLTGCSSSNEASSGPRSTAPGSSASNSTAKPTPKPGRLLYSRFDEASHEFAGMYSMRPDGTDDTPVPLPSDEGGGRWSHAGGMIAEAAPAADGRLTTAIIEPDGAVDRTLSLPRGTLNLVCTVWSPDDSRLACEGWDDDHPAARGIYTVRARDGLGVVRLTRSPSGLVDLPGDYAPDGRVLVFRRAPDEADGPLMIVKVDGGKPRALTKDVYEDDGAFAPDGRSIATSSQGRVFVLDGSGHVLHAIGEQGAYLFGPAWSPDG